VSTDAGAKGETADLAPAIGDPNTVGCSDGTREGFHDMANWPNIAGCAGGWTSSGLLTLSRASLCATACQATTAAIPMEMIARLRIYAPTLARLC